AFSPDGRSLLTGGPDTTIRLWNLRNGEERLRHRWDGQYWISSVAFSPDGKTAAAGGHEETRGVDLASGKVLRELKGQAGVTQHLAFSADGKTLVTASSAGSLRWWDIATGQKRRADVHDFYSVWGVLCRRDGGLLVDVSKDRVLRR